MSPRELVDLPGYTFAGHGDLWFGGVKASVDLYRKWGDVGAAVLTRQLQQAQAHPDDPSRWHTMKWREHGESIVAIRIGSAS